MLSRVSQFFASIRNYYAAAKLGRTNRGWRTREPKPQSWLLADAKALRARMHNLYRDSAMGRAVVDSAVTQIVPTPIEPRAAVVGANGEPNNRTREWNARAMKIWRRYSQDPRKFSLDGRTNYAQMQRQIARSLMLDGECFVVRHYRDNGPGLPNVRFEVVAPDRLVQRTINVRLQDNHRPGIEYDQDNRPTRYHFSRSEITTDEIVVEASDVCHVMVQLYPGQEIGESASAAIGELIYHYGRYFLAEVQGQEVAARIPLVTETEDGKVPGFGRGSAATGTATDGSSYELRNVDSLMILPLRSGEKVGQMPQMRPGSQFPAFTRANWQMIGAASGTPTEKISGNYDGMSWSTSKMASQNAEDRSREKRETLRDGPARFMWESFVDECLLTGLLQPLPLPYRENHYAATYTMPAVRGGDPMQEIQADQMELQAGCANWQDKLAKRGYTVEDFIAAYKEEQAALAAAGIDIDPYGPLDVAGAQPAQPEQPTDQAPEPDPQPNAEEPAPTA